MTTKAELIDQADTLGIDVPPNATKADISALIDSATAPTARGPRPIWEGSETRQQYQARLAAWKAQA